MKSVKKFGLLILCTAIILCCSLLFASATNSDQSIPLMTSGKACNVTIDYNNYSVDHKIVLKSNGLITIDVKSAIDDYGDPVDFDVMLQPGSTSAYAIWDRSTDDVTAKNGLYTFTVPLNKGTYFLSISPDDYPDRNEVITTKIKYTFAKATYWESEPNDTISGSDTLKPDYMYKALTDESYDGDFFNIKLTKGKYYTLKIDNYYELDYEYISVKMYDSSGTEISLYEDDAKKSGNIYYWDFRAPTTDKYYIEVSGGYGDEDISYRVGVYNKRITASKFPASLSYTTSTYNGKVKSPKVTVKAPDGTALKNKTDYTVSYQSGRKNVGEYTVTINYIGTYKGSKKLTFKIVPVTTELSAVSAGEESFTAKWKKQASQTTGYQLQYSTSSNFKKAKTVSITSTKTVSKKITSLKGGQKYYVRIRTFKTVNTENIYSKWSAAKSVVTKKAVSIKLGKSSATLYTGGTYTPSYTTYPSKVTVKWTTSNSSVAKVSSTGKITAVKSGTANITASFTYNKKTYKSTMKVTVKSPSLSLNKSTASVYRWASLTLKATAKPSGITVNWKTSNSNIATVNSKGVVNAKNVGTASITAYFTYGGRTYSKVCKVTVVKQNPVTLTKVDWDINSADGVEPIITIRNNTNKAIKNVEMDSYYKNMFGDPAYCSIYNSNYCYLWLLEGLRPYETKTFYWDPILYNGGVSRIDITKVTVTFEDNTKTTFNLNKYWYDSNYYYQ